MLDIVIEARNAAIGDTVKVKRILPFRLHRMDVLSHPHIGISTVSYLFGGQSTHRDSVG